jgi:hypothetical protein
MVAGKCVRRNQPLAADRAESALDRAHRVEACKTYRKARDINHGLTADAAIGGKESGEQAFGNLACPRNNRRPSGYRIGLRSPSSVPTTAEDDLPSPGGCIGAPARRISFSIAASPNITQCADVPYLRSGFPIEVTCAQPGVLVSAWFQRETSMVSDAAADVRSPDDRNGCNSPRNAQFADKTSEVRTSQTSCADGTRTLPGFRIGGIETR